MTRKQDSLSSPASRPVVAPLGLAPSLSCRRAPQEAASMAGIQNFSGSLSPAGRKHVFALALPLHPEFISVKLFVVANLGIVVM